MASSNSPAFCIPYFLRDFGNPFRKEPRRQLKAEKATETLKGLSEAELDARIAALEN